MANSPARRTSGKDVVNRRLEVKFDKKVKKASNRLYFINSAGTGVYSVAANRKGRKKKKK